MNHKKNPKIASLMHSLLEEIKKESESLPIENILSETQIPIQKDLVDSKRSYQEELKTLTQNRGRSLFFPYLGSGLGRGPYVCLNDGSLKLDLIGGIGVHILGHSHPAVLEAALEASLSDIVMQGNLQCNSELVRLSEKLVEISTRKSSLKHVWITTCGVMANENALKICRQKKKGARKVIAMKSAFAGRSTLMAEITDNPALRENLPRYEEVLRVPFYDKENEALSKEKSLKALQEHVSKHKNNICAFVLECVQGEGGIRVGSREYFFPLLEFCKQNSIPIWFDEVQSFCRTGHFFAYETLGLEDFVDVCTVGKALQSAATFFSEEFKPSPGLLGGTFCGSSVSLAVGYSILNFLDKGDFMGEHGTTSRLFHHFKKKLQNLALDSCEGLIKDIDGLGLMLAFTPLDGTKEKVKHFLDVLFKNGLMAFSCGRNPYRVRFLFPAIMTLNDMSVAEQIIERSLLEVNNQP